MKNKLYVFGSVNLDFMIEQERFPHQGETVNGKNFRKFFGGKGANQAIAAAILGVDTELIATVGVEELSLIKNHLEHHKVGTNYLSSIEGVHTGIAIVLQSEGDNRIILDSGANSFPSLSSLSKALDTAQTGDVLLLQFEIPVKDIFESIQLAKQKNLIVILNPTPVQAIPDYIYELVDYLILNQTEAETLVNIYPRSINDCENVFNILQDKGLNSLVLTLGSQGSVWIDRHSKLYYPSEEIQVVDSTGAGDAFIGMFVSGLINKQSPSTILQYCNKVGALTCLKRGAVIGVHSLSEVTKHLNEEEL